MISKSTGPNFASLVDLSLQKMIRRQVFVPSRDDAVPANFVGKIEVGQSIHSIPLESA